MSLPEGWAIAQADQICDRVQSGGTPKGGFLSDAGIPFLKVYNIVDQQIDFDYRPQFVSTEIHNSELAKSRALPGDVLMNIVGPPLGKVAVVPADYAQWNLNQAITLFRPSDAILSEWLSHFLKGGDSVQSVINETRGTAGQVNISLSQCRAFEIPVPPLAEQRRIVAKLDALTARLARARAELDRVPVLAANLRKETLRNAFGQGTPDVPIRDLISDIRYGTAKKCDYGGGAVSVLRIPNVQGGRIDLTDMKSADFDDKELAKLRLVQGDVLVIRSNGSLDLVGRSAIVDDSAADMLFAGYLIRMRVDPAKCLPEYLHHFLQAPACRETLTMGAKSTSGVNNVNAQQLQALAVPLPDLATQASLIMTIEQAFTRADRLEAEAARARALLDRLEAAILARAFRGELVPQDLADEPASTLLARIRAQRAAAPQAKRGRKAKAA